MAGLEYYANEADLPPGTLAGLFLEAVDRYGDGPAFRYFVGGSDRLRDISYREALDIVRQVVGGLRELGLERGDRVALLSDNRPEWALTDYGCVCSGVVPVPVYGTLVDDQVAYILENAGVKALFAENREQLEKGRSAADMARRDLRYVV
ncbi:MAG TPA: AMP-binding protein, partial [Longimicrobiales bacterium]|nr:AMP-binding protein [Longimicrobiales bacterium]